VRFELTTPEFGRVAVISALDRASFVIAINFQLRTYILISL
jgi:hypothetical protein